MTMSPQTNSVQRYVRSATMAACCLVASAYSLWLQAKSVQAQDDLSVTASFKAQTPLTPETPIELYLNRSLKADEGRIVVIINRTDLTSLFIIDDKRLVYSPTLVPLPLGLSQ